MRTDERDKSPSRKLTLYWMLSRTRWCRQLLPVISPLFWLRRVRPDEARRAQTGPRSVLGTGYRVLLLSTVRKLFLLFPLNFPLPLVLISSPVI